MDGRLPPRSGGELANTALVTQREMVGPALVVGGVRYELARSR